MTNLVPFSFDSHEIRILTDDNGEPLFVAKDVAIALGYDNPQQAVRLHCKKSKSLKELGCYPVAPHNNQPLALDPQIKLIPESDVYRLTLKSTLESAEQFQDWLCEEVIPSIRKTGRYESAPDAPRRTPAQRHVDPIITKARQADALMTTYLKVSKMLGTDIPTARAIAVERVHAEVGMDFRPLLLNNSVTEVPMTPTNLGKEIGASARKMNDILMQNGLLEKDENSEWCPTEKGKPYCTVHPFKSPHSEHVGYRVLWYRRVLDALDIKQEDAA